MKILKVLFFGILIWLVFFLLGVILPSKFPAFYNFAVWIITFYLTGYFSRKLPNINPFILGIVWVITVVLLDFLTTPVTLGLWNSWVTYSLIILSPWISRTSKRKTQ